MSHTFKMNNSSCPPFLKCQKDTVPFQREANTFTKEYTRKQYNLRANTNPAAALQISIRWLLWDNTWEPCREGEGAFPGRGQPCPGHWGLCASWGESRSIWESGTDKALPAHACQGAVQGLALILSPCWHCFRESFLTSIFSCGLCISLIAR